ncbi:MAG: type VI secretion system tip protein VgrG [Planctomycetes bacterium]|nr:type VI secretion system tip protein VgrG [Planctomycetota bacterium]
MVLLSSTLRGRVLRFDTPALARNTLLVSGVVGEERLSHPYRFHLDLVSTRPDMDAAELMRAPARLAMKEGVDLVDRRRGIRTRVTHGTVASFEQRESAAGWVVYRATLVPRLWRLSLAVHSRIFVDKTIPEIVEEVLRENGLTEEDREFRLSGAYGKKEYVVQHRETDLAFVSRWLEHEGIFYFFRQEEERERVVFADSPEGYEGGEELPYRPMAGEEDWFRPGRVREIACRTSLLPREVVLREYNWRTPSAGLEVRETVSEEGAGTVYEYGEHYKDVEEGRRLARIRAEERRCRGRMFAGRSDAKGLRAGRVFRLTGHYRFDERYVVVEVRHDATQSLALGSPAAPVARYGNEFTAIPAEEAFRPERRTPWPKGETWNARIDAAGDGEYAELDGEGRYKVQLPLDASGRGGGTASRWVRKMEPYGGAGYGIHFPLHKGTEVVLTHVNGDVDRPVIAGAATNPETRSPVVDENQTQSVIRTAGRNEIRIEDVKGAEVIRVTAERDWELIVRNDAREQIANNRTVVVGKDEVALVRGYAHETVEGKRFVKVVGDLHETILGNGIREIKGTRSTRVAGSVVEEVAGSRSEQVKGPVYLKGAQVVIEAESGVTLKCGGHSVVIDAAGVTATGGTVTLDGKPTKIDKGPGSPAMAAKAVPLLEPDRPRRPGSAGGESAEDELPIKVEVVAVKFVSDHGLMKDRRGNFFNEGDPVPEPEWERGREMGRISHTKNRHLEIDATFQVDSGSLTGTLVGMGGAFVSFRKENVTLASGQAVRMTSEEPLPDKVQSVLLRIEWRLEGTAEGDVACGTSGPHRIYVTYGTPIDAQAEREDGITVKRMRHAVEWVASSGKKDPLEIVRWSLFERFPGYRLDFDMLSASDKRLLEDHPELRVALETNGFPRYTWKKSGAWRLAKSIKYGPDKKLKPLADFGAECQAMVHFTYGVLHQVGIPGADIQYVTADVRDGHDPSEPVIQDHGKTGPYGPKPKPYEYALVGRVMEEGDEYTFEEARTNSFEAYLRFTHEGKEHWFGGGLGSERGRSELLSTVFAGVVEYLPISGGIHVTDYWEI